MTPLRVKTIVVWYYTGNEVVQHRLKTPLVLEITCNSQCSQQYVRSYGRVRWRATQGRQVGAEGAGFEAHAHHIDESHRGDTQRGLSNGLRPVARPLERPSSTCEHNQCRADAGCQSRRSCKTFLTGARVEHACNGMGSM